MRTRWSVLRALAALAVAGLAASGASLQASAWQRGAASLAPATTGSATPADDTVRLERFLVTLNVTVQDSQGRHISGLRSSRFTVYDDKVAQSIAFFKQDDAPATLGFIFDLSGSMAHRMRRARLALERFLENCHRDDEFFLVGFNEQVELLRDLTSDALLLSHLTLLEPRGRTALYDATVVGIEKALEGRHPKRALLIISDGQDNSSRYTYRELREMAKESDVMVYALGIGDPDDPLRSYGEQVLGDLCRITGGRAFFPAASEQLADYSAAIALELRHQYSIGFYPTEVTPGRRWKKLKVKLDAPNGLPSLKVRARQGYYTPVR